MLHGLLTWSVYTLLSVYLVTTSVGAVLGGVGSLIGRGFSAAGSAIGATMPNVGEAISTNLNIDNKDLETLKSEALTILRQTGKAELQPENLANKAEKVGEEAKEAGKEVAQDPNKIDQEADKLIGKLFNVSEDVFSEVDKEALVNVVVARTDKSKAEATQLVNNWVEAAENVKKGAKNLISDAKEVAQNVAQDVKETTLEVSEDVTNSIGKFAIYAFITLLLGAGSAIWGSVFTKNKQKYDDAVNAPHVY